MFAFAMAAVQHQANKTTTQKKQIERFTKPLELIRWSIQEIRRIAQRLAQRRIRHAHVVAGRSDDAPLKRRTESPTQTKSQL
jgi:hypothetical protein